MLEKQSDEKEECSIFIDSEIEDDTSVVHLFIPRYTFDWEKVKRHLEFSLYVKKLYQRIPDGAIELNGRDKVYKKVELIAEMLIDAFFPSLIVRYYSKTGEGLDCYSVVVDELFENLREKCKYILINKFKIHPLKKVSWSYLTGWLLTEIKRFLNNKRKNGTIYLLQKDNDCDWEERVSFWVYSMSGDDK